MRDLVANLQAALEYKKEELRIYMEKFEAETGKKQPFRMIEKNSDQALSACVA